MQQVPKCVFCDSQSTIRGHSNGYIWNCPRCGEYALTGTAEATAHSRPIANPGAVSGWIRQQNAMGIVPPIDSDSLEALRSLTKPLFRERAERYLLAAVAKCKRLNDEFQPSETALIGASYSDAEPEAMVIVHYLQDEGLIDQRPGGRWRIKPRGYIVSDELRTRRAASTQAFVAMWFADEIQSAYDRGLEPGIQNAGFTPMIIKQKEHANKIDDEIIAEIRRSAFLVADFTGHRGGVYFEAGYAMGRGLPVILTCRRGDIEKLHFDIRQYNCIDWSEPAELAVRLQKRIEALIGRGPLTTR